MTRPENNDLFQFLVERLLVVLVFLCAGGCVGFGQNANVVFLPVGKTLIGPSNINSVLVRKQYYGNEIKAVIDLPECWSSEQDTNGHWGDIVADLQLSFRLETNSFSVGAPIVGKVILRNTGTNSLSVLSPKLWDLVFFATLDAGNGAVSSVAPPMLSISGPISLTIPAHRQAKLEGIRLDEVLDFSKPGRYSLKAVWRGENPRRLLELRSGTISILVVKETSE